MPRERKLPTDKAVWHELRSQHGLTWKEIGAHFGVSEQSAWEIGHKVVPGPPKLDYREFIPWTLPAELSRHPLVDRLRDVAKRHFGLPPRRPNGLEQWCAMMDDHPRLGRAVVIYNPAADEPLDIDPWLPGDPLPPFYARPWE